MSSRVTGAGLALIAVALLAVSALTPAVLPAQLSLFAGHPTVAEHTRMTQDVYVGLYSAELCNSGGDGTCKSGDATGGFRAFAFAELGLTGLLAASALTLALLTLRRSERHKAAARVVWVSGGLTIACAAALVILGPFHGASAPIGIGMVLHAAGILGAMIGGAIAIRPPPPIRLRVAERGAQLTALPTAQAFNRRALRSDGPPRPGEPGYPPHPVHDLRPPSPDVPLPNPFAPPAGPPSHDDRPFAAAPQLRPLYDANPVHGGTGGLLPIDPTGGSAPRPAGGAVGVPTPRLAALDPTGSSAPRPASLDRPVIAAGPPAPVPRAVVPAMTGIPPMSLAADEPTAATPPLADEPRPVLPFADASRPALPFADASRPALPFADASRPGMPPFPTDELRPELRPTVQRFVPDAPRLAADEPRPMPPPPPSARAKPPTAPPPLPASVVAAAQPPPPPPPAAAHGAHKPRTQVSLVPPMPDNDLPIAPPTAQIVADVQPEPAGSPSSTDPMSFPRPETPLAPPPLPIAPPPPIRRESPLPRPLRDSQAPKPAALRAAVPMPVRAGRSAPSPTRPPPAPTRSAPPRPTIAAAVPPIPAIPAIPPIPAPRRADTEITDPDGRADVSGDGDRATISRVPVEVGDYISQTNVSVDVPSPEGGRAGSAPDTSPSGEPVVPRRAEVTDPSEAMAIAAAIAARPTIQTPAQGPPRAADQPTIIAPPISPIAPSAAPAAAPSAAPSSAPAVRDRPMPKLPISTAPDSLPPPKDNKQATGPSPACPQCEAPMAWVEEHLRFYCKSCRMYF
jgi:hypothetical protein